MAGLAAEPIAQALATGDVIGYAELAGFDEAWAFRVRNLVGDCRLCPLVSARSARDPAHRWLTAPPVSNREAYFHAARLAPPSFAAADGGASV